MPQKFTSFSLNSLSWSSRSRVCTYGDLSPEFITRNCVHLGYLLYFFYFQLHHPDDDGDLPILVRIVILIPSELEYTNDVLLSENPSKLQVFVDRLNDNVGVRWLAFYTL